MSDASQTALVPIEKLHPVEIYAPEALQRNVPLGHPATQQAYLVSMEKGGGHGSK